MAGPGASSPSSRDAKGGRTAQTVAPEFRRVAESSGPFTIAWYWTTLGFAALSLLLVWIFYSPGLRVGVKILYWVTGALAGGLGLWALLGVLNRYEVAKRVGASAQRAREARAGTEPEGEVTYRENVVVRTFKQIWRLVLLLVLFFWNTFVFALYLIEITIIRLILGVYDALYYVTYAAWVVAFYAVRIASRVTHVALRVTWAVLRQPTRVPGLRGLWTRGMRPSIMGKYNHRVQHLKDLRARRLDQKRRLVAAQGGDPDAWQKDQERRHHFILPHPHYARKGLRARMERRHKEDLFRRERWRAFRRGLPVPPKPKKEKPPKEGKRESEATPGRPSRPAKARERPLPSARSRPTSDEP